MDTALRPGRVLRAGLASFWASIDLIAASFQFVSAFPLQRSD
jgi:hypothetical protein